MISELSKYDYSEVDRRSTFVIFKTDHSQRLYLDYTGALYTDEAVKIYQHHENVQKVLENIEKNEFDGFEIDSESVKEFSEIVNVRWPHVPTAIKIIERIKEVKELKDSIGGTATGVIYNCPVGIGEPCFDKFEAVLGMAMLSLPATKGFEFGSGFEGTKLLGSQHNDMFIGNSDEEEKKIFGIESAILDTESLLATKTNNAGGTLGGITNGNFINFKVAVKPVSSISQGKYQKLNIK